jgi:hypothetical protein
MKQDLFSNLILRRNGSNISIGGRALIPHKGSLNEAVKLRPKSRDAHLATAGTEIFFFSKTVTVTMCK